MPVARYELKIVPEGYFTGMDRRILNKYDHISGAGVLYRTQFQ